MRSTKTPEKFKKVKNCKFYWVLKKKGEKSPKNARFFSPITYKKSNMHEFKNKEVFSISQNDMEQPCKISGLNLEPNLRNNIKYTANFDF